PNSSEYEGPAAVGAGAVQEGGALGAVGHDRGAEAAAERGGEGELEAGLDRELVGQRAGAVERRVRAQGLVGGGELGAGPRGVAARGLRGCLGGAAGAAGDVGGFVGGRQRRAALGDDRGEPLLLALGGGALLLERRQLTLELGLAVGRKLRQLGLQRLDAR